MRDRIAMTSPLHQDGQALVEYIYVFPILIMLILGAIQFGFIYQTKATLNYAVFVATRQGALNNGSMDAIVDGLVSGMMPLFTHSQGGARDMALLKSAWQLSEAQMTDPNLTTITIVNPTETALNAYSALSESGDEIPNDNLMYRSTDIVGGAGMNIQDANLLKVRVTYCYRMAVPIINKMIYNLAIDPPAVPAIGSTAADMLDTEGGGSTSKPCTNHPADEYRIPITSEAIVRMQTPFQDPGKWVGP